MGNTIYHKTCYLNLPKLCALAISLVLYSGAIHAVEKKPDVAPPLRIVTQPFEKTAQNHEVYFFKALELALTKTQATDGPFELDSLKEVLSNKRYIA